MWYTMNGREIPLRIKYTEALDQVVLSDFVIVPAVSFSGGIERFLKELILFIQCNCIFLIL